AQPTGLLADPYFSASKIRWLLDTLPGLRERAASGDIAFGTIDSFLLWRLTGGRLHASDVTNASRTMLFDLHRLAWDEELRKAFGIPRALLPEVRPTGDDFGATLPEPFGDAIPIAGRSDRGLRIAGDRARGARSGRLSDARPRRRDGRRCRSRNRPAAGRWRHGGQRLDDAVCRRHPAGDD